MSWLSDLAGRAERLLDSVDRQANETLKNSVPLSLGLSTSTSGSGSGSGFGSVGDGDGDGDGGWQPEADESVLLAAHGDDDAANLNHSHDHHSSNSGSSSSSGSNSVSTNQPSRPDELGAPGSILTEAGALVGRTELADANPANWNLLNDGALVKNDLNKQDADTATHSMGHAGASKPSRAAEPTTVRTDASAHATTGSSRVAVAQHPVVASVQSSEHADAAARPLRLERDAKVGAHSAASLAATSTPASHASHAVSTADETAMLRNEIKSLNEEIALHGRRSKNMQINLDEARKQISVVERQVAAKEQQVREQTLREEQLHGQIKDLERQQQALKAQLLESDKILSLRDNTITDLQKVKQDVLHDQAAVAEVQSSAFESLRARLVEAERLLDAETQLTASLKQAQIKTRAETDEVRLDLERQLTVAHTAAQDQMTQLGQLKQTLAAQRSDNDTIKTEFAEYKNRAAKVLQTKEKVIADMRLLAETSSTLMNSGPGAEAARSELIAAQRERDQLSEELNETRLQVSQLRSQIQELETQHQAETDMLQDHLHEIENAAQEEKTNHTNLLADMRARVEDADFARNEVFKQKTALQAQLLDRAAEIERLHAQLSTRTNNSVNQVDLENRLRTLTENLIRKQTEIETLMSEKNSLHLQLETERNKRAKEVRLQIDHPPAANSLEEDNTKLRPISSIIPAAMEARPNANLTRRVRQAATVLDTFSIRLGRFLRIYPMARVFVIFYMLLLHLWVMIVLFTYSPELHSAGHEGVEPIDPFPR